ncbi:hypothetical protein [Succinimonas sp.]|uniref:hypothetical protein n=1 Tax=Succinimonas sp. TaxID=1936151 RepID=UPI00386D06B4
MTDPDFPPKEKILAQTWMCRNAEKILDSCKYSIEAFDIFGTALTGRTRARMLGGIITALLEAMPSCRAGFFLPSKKIMTREGMLFFTRSYESRFLDYAVNFRLYNRPDTPYILLDTLGMQVLSMPDVQYFLKISVPGL